MFKSGKTSIGIRRIANALAKVMATMATITVIGCLRAKRSGPMRESLERYLSVRGFRSRTMNGSVRLTATLLRLFEIAAFRIVGIDGRGLGTASAHDDGKDGGQDEKRCQCGGSKTADDGPAQRCRLL